MIQLAEIKALIQRDALVGVGLGDYRQQFLVAEHRVAHEAEAAYRNPRFLARIPGWRRPPGRRKLLLQRLRLWGGGQVGPRLLDRSGKRRSGKTWSAVLT